MISDRYRPLRYIVPILILVVGAALLAFYFVNELRLLEQRLHSSAESDLRVMAAFSSGDLEIAYRTGQIPDARAAIERLAGNRQIDMAFLVDDKGRILFSTKTRFVGRELTSLDDPRLDTVMSEARRSRGVAIRHWYDPDHVAGAFPINMRTDPDAFLPQETGWLLIDSNLSQLHSRLVLDLQQRIVPYALALGAFCVLLWLFFRATLLKRINRLTMATRKIAKGDFSDRPDIGEGDELSDLAAEFRAMADHLQRHTEELDFLSHHDGLTGLLNRRGFEQHLVNLLAHIRHSGGHYLLCFLDIDGFRVINDTQGHAAGDNLLREIASRLRTGLGSDTPVGRLAGDEFALVLTEKPGIDPADAAGQIQRLMADFRFQWGEESYRVAFNIGVVRLERQMESPEKAMSLADAACYAAKKTPHTRIRVWDAAEHEVLEQHGEMHWVGRIQSALDQDRFELYAQPIYPARGKSGIRLEILVRMRDPDGTLVLPDRFLPAAEHYNLISQIDRWVIRNAFAFFREHRNVLSHLDMCATNLSALSLGNEELIDSVTQEVQRPNGLDATQLCFEVTETAVVTNLSAASVFIDRIRGLGCRFALDDFGSGVSSFGYLKNLNVDIIKIDGLFVRGALSDSSDRAIVRSINDIAHEMGKQTVAEFVESRELAQEMRRIGVDYLQGNGLARTGPIRTVLGRAARRAKSRDG